MISFQFILLLKSCPEETGHWKQVKLHGVSELSLRKLQYTCASNPLIMPYIHQDNLNLFQISDDINCSSLLYSSKAISRSDVFWTIFMIINICRYPNMPHSILTWLTSLLHMPKGILVLEMPQTFCTVI